MSRFLRNRKAIACVLYSCSIILIFVALYYGAKGHPLRSDFSLGVSLSACVACFIYQVIHRKQFQQYFGELSLCYLGFFLLIILSIIRIGIASNKILFIFLWIGAFVVPFIYYISFIIKKHLKLHISRVKKKSKDPRRILVAVISAAAVILSLISLDAYAVCDSYSYFSAAQNASLWDFTFDDAMTLRLCSHQSYAATIWYIIGIHLTPNNVIGMRLVNIAFLVVMIRCFSGILDEVPLVKNGSNVLYGIIVAVFACNPLMLGIITEVSLDFFQCTFFVCMIWAFLKKRNVIIVFSVLSLAFSKESSLFILFGFGIGIVFLFVSSFYNLKKNRGAHYDNSGLKSATSYYAGVGALLVFAGLLAFFSLRSLGSWNTVNSGSHLNTFTFNFDHAVTIIKQMFIMNFSWLFLLLSVCGVVVIAVLYRGKLSGRIKTYKDFVPIYFSGLLYFIFNMLYLTYCVPRYLAPFIVLMVLTLAMILFALPRSLVSNGVASIVLLFSLIQCFTTIDPLTRLAFRNVDIGDSMIVSTRKFVNDDGVLRTDEARVSSRDLGATACYNRQYSSFSKVFNKFLRDIEYDKDTLIVLDPIYEYATHNDLLGGWMYDWTTHYYDKSNGSLVTYQTDTQFYVLNSMPANERFDSEKYQGFKRIIFVSFDYRSDYYASLQPISGYPLVGQGIVESCGWSLEWYQIK